MNSEDVSGDEDLLVARILTNSSWDVSKLRTLVSKEMVEKIIASSIQISSGIDVHIWQPNLDGSFSTKSAWHLIRAQGLGSLWRKWLWHKFVPKKMSLLCWRAKKQVLPVDDILIKLGISLVSKCHCCVLPQQESIDHILCSGDLAIMVLIYFAGILAFNCLNSEDGMLL